jgi:ribokinase
LRRKLDVETVAVSLGRAGIVGTSPDDDFFHVVPPHVEPVDTTGAGDAAAGAFLAGLSKGWPFRQANALATLAATYSVTRMYCIPSYPTVDELHAWEEATSETHVTAEFRTLP